MNDKTNIKYESSGGVIEFTFASDFWITSIDGVSDVTVQISESQGVGQIGSTMTNQSVQPKTLTVNGALFGDVEANRRKLLDCVLPNEKGILTVLKDGESWYLEGVPSKTPTVSDGYGVQEFQFSFRAPYPYWRSTSNISTQLAGITPMFRFPFKTGKAFRLSKYTETYFTEIENSGNLPVGIDILFYASTEVENPGVFHVDTGTYIKLADTKLSAGESVKISTVYGRRGVTFISSGGEESNGFRYLDKNSNLDMMLLPGKNTFRYIADDDNRIGLRVTITAPKGVVSGV